MVEDIDAVNLILLFDIVCSAIVMVIIIATIGRQLADIEYQRALQLKGIRWIQSMIDIRKDLGRLFLGTAYFVSGIIAITSTDPITKLFVSRTLFLALLLFTMLSAMWDWYDEDKQIRILMKTNPNENLSNIRSILHSLNQDLQIVYGITELYRSKIPSSDIQLNNEFEIATKAVSEKIDNLQQLIRASDPAYKFEKHTKVTGEQIC